MKFEKVLIFSLIIFPFLEMNSQTKEHGLGMQLGYAYQNINRIV